MHLLFGLISVHQRFEKNILPASSGYNSIRHHTEENVATRLHVVIFQKTMI
jgi:hypothetical protein